LSGEHKHKLILSSEQIRSRAALIVSGLPVDGTVEVIVKPHKRNRSLEQNATYWQWITIIGNELGNTKDEMADIYKGMFLVPIFTRDDPGFAEMMAHLQSLPDRQHKIFTREVVRLASTTQCNVQQFSEYLDDIARHAADLGIKLPAPEWR